MKANKRIRDLRRPRKGKGRLISIDGVLRYSTTMAGTPGRRAIEAAKRPHHPLATGSNR